MSGSPVLKAKGEELCSTLLSTARVFAHIRDAIQSKYYHAGNEVGMVCGHGEDAVAEFGVFCSRECSARDMGKSELSEACEACAACQYCELRIVNPLPSSSIHNTDYSNGAGLRKPCHYSTWRLLGM